MPLFSNLLTDFKTSADDNRVLNKQMFQLIVKIDANSVGLPLQVELQPPVILLDAFGLRAPFHLDSITSADVSCPLPPSGDVYCAKKKTYCHRASSISWHIASNRPALRKLRTANSYWKRTIPQGG